MADEIPRTRAGRLEMVAEALCGPCATRTEIAARMGVSRRSLYRYLAGRGGPRVDDVLLDWLARERSACHGRAREIGKLETKFARYVDHRREIAR